MRKLAWLVVVAFFLSSALFFVRYAALTETASRPEAKMLIGLSHLLLSYAVVRQATEAIGYLQGMNETAEFSLYVSLGLALVGVLSFVLLAASQFRRDYDYDHDDSDAGAQTCPRCTEPIRGFEIICRACGYGFGIESRPGSRK
jgi:hypothetical protein